jgi:SET domain-containing protein
MKVYIAKSKVKNAGRGIFAARNFKRGEVIERCPVLVLPRKDYLLLKGTELRNYYFMWGKSTSAICFGYGSLYNHSYEPNATYRKRIKEKTIDFIAIRSIKRGEEIAVNYNYGKPKSKRTLWIKSIKSAGESQ